MFWSSQRIKREQSRHHLILDGKYDSNSVKQSAYELTLSREVIATPDGTENQPTAGEGDTFPIPPGQFAFLYTNERIQIPPNVIGFISIKFREKCKGLVNISGFHVDPGYTGRIKFTVYNAGNRIIHLGYDLPYFSLWFADLDEATEDPYPTVGRHAQQFRVTPADREQMSEGYHSCFTLHNRLQKLEDQIGLMIAVGAIVIIPLLIGVGVAVFDDSFKAEPSKPAIIGTILTTGVIVGLVIMSFVLFKNKLKK